MGYRRIGEGPIEDRHLLGARQLLLRLHPAPLDVRSGHRRVANEGDRVADSADALTRRCGAGAPSLPNALTENGQVGSRNTSREEFEFERHCSGPNFDAMPNDIIRRIERYSDVKIAEAFAIPDLDREVKWHCKYARQNGIHVSPTFMVDGLVRADMSSGDPVADWASRILKD